MNNTLIAAALIGATAIAPVARAADNTEPSTGDFFTAIGRAVLIERIDANIMGAARESGFGAKVLKASTGISVKDIKKYDIWGGPNSFFRKPFG